MIHYVQVKKGIRRIRKQVFAIAERPDSTGSRNGEQKQYVVQQSYYPVYRICFGKCG